MMSEKSGRFLRLTDLLDRITRDVHGEPVGRIADVIIDPDEGRIAYLHIQLNRPGEPPNLSITVPWSVISGLPTSGRDIRVAARKQTLLRLGSGPRSQH